MGRNGSFKVYILDVTSDGHCDKSAGWKTWKLKNKNEAPVWESRAKDLLGYGSTADGQQEFPKSVSPLGVVQGASTVRLFAPSGSRPRGSTDDYQMSSWSL